MLDFFQSRVAGLEFSPVRVRHRLRFFPFRIDVLPFQFAPIRRDRVALQIRHHVVAGFLHRIPPSVLPGKKSPAPTSPPVFFIRYRTSTAANSWCKSIVRFSSSIVTFGRLFLVRGGSVSRVRNPGLPRAAVGEQLRARQKREENCREENDVSRSCAESVSEMAPIEQAGCSRPPSRFCAS